MNTKNFGTLYIVATPIGNLKDITLRALEVLQSVDLIAAEDTRQSKKLLDNYCIKTPLISLHEHNEEFRSKLILEKLAENKNIALISDAGTPLISDPGYQLVTIAQAAQHKIVPIPGPCAAIAALSVSGLPTDRFVFEGFLPAKATQRRQKLEKLKSETRSIIFYESIHRILESLLTMIGVFGANRMAVYARELTKMYETIQSGTLQEIYDFVENNSQQRKGEIVLIVHGVEEAVTDTEELDMERILKILTAELPGSQAVDLTVKIFNNRISRKKLYSAMLQSKKANDDRS
ncbi:MAG: 16S rRNA (cytidine(1402)-2'-O)-methyltransferase [Gammaproteobacteria bacterium GWE2_37_16]|nr:MAG: 16S rRNA (cytidine(1402)-2'-O)-methyltransferase [Gammaproteobacteria bacterium GWE2_37_16]